MCKTYSFLAESQRFAGCECGLGERSQERPLRARAAAGRPARRPPAVRPRPQPRAKILRIKHCIIRSLHITNPRMHPRITSLASVFHDFRILCRTYSILACCTPESKVSRVLTSRDRAPSSSWDQGALLGST